MLSCSTPPLVPGVNSLPVVDSTKICAQPNVAEQPVKMGPLLAVQPTTPSSIALNGSGVSLSVLRTQAVAFGTFASSPARILSSWPGMRFSTAPVSMPPALKLIAPVSSKLSREFWSSDTWPSTHSIGEPVVPAAR
eukprot:2440059-Prymnesium_polylepis.1